MTTIPTTPTSFDAGALRRAYADRDPRLMSALYADDAAVEIVDSENTPSRPQRLEGRAAIDAFHADILSRDMSHTLDHVAVGDGVVGYSVRCAYPDGTRVLCITTARLEDGRIAEQVVVQAWDR
jgi:hypothetical protein